jgi:hypothetical protein
MFAPQDRRFRDIDNMWNSRSRLTIGRSMAHLSDLARELIGRNETDTRLFRFCVNRLQRLADVSDVEIEVPEKEALKKLVMDRFVEDASAADFLCGFLRAVGLTEFERFSLERQLLDPSTYLYEWQRFHLVTLLLDQGHSSPRFHAAAEQSVTEKAESPMIPRDLALIVLARQGDNSWRERIAENFGDYCRNHIEQRSGLIAVHELGFNDAIKGQVSDLVPPALRGVYRTLNSDMRGTYVTRRPRIPASTLIDLISAYV